MRIYLLIKAMRRLSTWWMRALKAMHEMNTSTINTPLSRPGMK